MLGQGIAPEGHDPVADAIPAGEMQRALASLRSAVLAAAQALPSHADFLRSYCLSEDGRG
jgi:tryptophan halogenase